MSPAPSKVCLGRAIRRLRTGRNLSIEALAFAADMHPTYVSTIERGHSNPSWSKLCGQPIPLTASTRTPDSNPAG